MKILMLSIAILASYLFTVWRLVFFLHLLQLNSYRNRRLFTFLKSHSRVMFSPRDSWVMGAFMLIVIEADLLFLVVWAAIFALFFYFRTQYKEKKKLVMTPRAKRLLGVSILMLTVMTGVIGYGQYIIERPVLGLFVCLWLVHIFSFILLMSSNLCLLPLEFLINRWYFNSARRKISSYRGRLCVVGITGSYGKTSTKFILDHFLSHFFSVLKTPESYNTPMGISKVIRSSLKPTHNIFITEMGARQKGDIQNLCRLVKPAYGILTAIGDQHLETFKTIEAIQQTKFELAHGLAPNHLIANADNAYIRSYITEKKLKVITYGIDALDVQYQAKNIQLSSTGMRFEIEAQPFQTQLLGRHHVYNILAAVALCRELKLSLSDLAKLSATIAPIPHRLELKPQPNGITIIDDAFNANPVGAAVALDVLQEIAGDRKIIVTPGLIELGEKSHSYHLDWGKKIAHVCDYVILVGRKQTISILEGMKRAKFSESNYYVATDFFDAKKHLETITKTGDMILFENDLTFDY